MICCVIGSMIICWGFQIARKIKYRFVSDVEENHAELWQLYPKKD